MAIERINIKSDGLLTKGELMEALQKLPDDAIIGGSYDDQVVGFHRISKVGVEKYDRGIMICDDNEDHDYTVWILS